MAKKKFLNLDNMNILWDNIDRNFLRREDIPYTEFEELETDSNTIIGAINELYKLISGGVNPVYPSISCGTSSITENYQSITKTVTATYKDFVKINDPQVTGGSWLTVTQTGSDDSRTYSIKLAENNGATRTGSIVLSCTGRNGNAQHTISVKQNGIGDATITVESSFPTTLSDHKAFSRSACYVTYSNWTSINQPTSDASWLTIKEVTGNVDRCNYQISATENTGAQRSAKLTFSCVGKNGKTISKTHTITQPEAGAASISFNPNPINVAWDAEDATVQVTYSNHSSILTPTETLTWVDAIEEVTHSGNTYTYRISGITKNPSNTSRTGKLKFGCNNLLGSPVYSEVSLVQAKAPAGTLTVTPTSKTISADGGTITFTVAFSNSEYYWVEKDTSATWLTIPTTSDPTSGGSTSKSYTVTVAANTNTTSRSTHLIFKCHGHDSQDQNVKVTITQSAYTPDVPEPQVLPMYWGHIPTDLAIEYNINAPNGFFDNLSQPCIDACIQRGTIVKIDDPNSMVDEITSYGVVNKPAYATILIPENDTLYAKNWNSLEQDHDFYDVTGTGRVDNVSNGNKIISINGINYKLYGQIINTNLDEINTSMYFVIRK